MIGLMPCSLALDQNSKAPNTLPWSVIAIASMPSSAVRAKRSSSRAAPSSMEYSVCTCRCTNPSRDPPAMDALGSFPGIAPLRRTQGRRSHSGEDAQTIRPRREHWHAPPTLPARGARASGPIRTVPDRGREAPAHESVVLGLEHRPSLTSGVHGPQELGVVVGVRGLDHRDDVLV